MNRDDIQKLLGGYATGTLTPEEQQALFEAALDDQELFDAIAREQALRDLLRDPAAKAHLLSALDHRPPTWYERLVQGWRPLAAAVALAGASVIAVVVVRQSSRPPQPAIVARMSPPPVAADTQSTPPAAANPAPQTSTVRDSDVPAIRPANEIRSQGAVAPKGVAEQDQLAKLKQQLERKLERKDTGSAETASGSKAEAVPLPTAPPVPRQLLSTGFRGGVAGGVGGVGPAAPSASPAEPKAPLAGRSGNALGGAIGGVLGGVVGGVPGAAPPAPPPRATLAPPKVETQSAQSQLAQSGPSQARQSQQAPFQPSQGQQGALSQSTPAQSASAQSDQLRSARPPAAQETVNVQATAALLDAVSSPDVKSLFYGNFVDPQSVNAPAFRSATPGDASTEAALTAEARKKAAAQSEKTEAKPQSMVVNSIRATTAPAALRPNLGVRYSVLRKTAGGALEPIDPQNVKTGDTVALQLTPNQSGTLSVEARSSNGTLREVMSRSVEALLPYTTPQLRPGEKEIQVVLTRPQSAVTNLALRDEKSARAEPARQSTTEPATYVVSAPAFPELRFTITLNYK